MKRGRWLPFLLTICAAIAPVRVYAQARCDVQARAKSGDFARHWGAPLNRTVTLHAGKVSLRTALERVASAASIRLSYSSDLLPLAQQRCATFDSVAVGDVLVDLLDGSAVEAVVAGNEHVVLAPSHNSKPVPQSPANEDLVVALPPVVVAGQTPSTPPRPISASTDVIDGRQLAQQSIGTIAEAINAAVPGLWVWPSATSSLSAQYGSMRGASSFGPSHPKVYIDGIEVANPLLLSRFSPESIERIEVIRGPEGAALYGADAINGVTNIITRNEGATGGPHARIRTDFGFSSSSFVAGTPLAQDHTLSLRAGSEKSSASVNVAYGTVGQFVPAGDAHHLAADGSVRYTSSRTQITGTLRFFDEQAGTPISPLLVRTVTGLDNLATQDPQAAMQYTAGFRAQFTPNARWTHSLVLGVDGYHLDDAATQWSPLLSATDSALRAVTAGVRGTLRYNSTARFGLGQIGTAAFTVGADHSALHQRGTLEQRPYPPESENERRPPSNPGSMPKPATGGTSQWSSTVPPRASSYSPTMEETETYEDFSQSNTGFSTQLNATLFDRLSLSGGVRVERQIGGGASSHFATMPMFGTSYAIGNGPVSLKLRAAYGKGIRWPQLPTHEGEYMHMRSNPVSLAPEEQSGVEGGIDLMLGRAFTLQATRFDQTASGLIQRTTSTAPDTSMARGPRMMWENVGEIANKGWELQARVQHGALSLTGNVSFVDSHVRQLANSYMGDLSAGDRMLAVPARTMGLTAGVTRPTWNAGITAYRAANWINYDRIALSQALVNATNAGTELTGAQLRAFWRRYDGNTHLRLALSHTLLPGVTGLFTADNLFNYQVGEPDNSSVTPGRTISLGLRASF